MQFVAQTLRQVHVGLGTLLALLLIFSPAIAHAEGEDPAAIEKITNLNKKALDAYDALEFEDARKLLKQALDLCASAGLDKHPIKARTHIHMGVVLIAAKQQELGIKQFRKALEIQPDIQVTKALANPEILQAFEEAGAGAPPPGAGGDATGPEPGVGAGATGPVAPQGPPQEAADITHMSISRGKKGKPISITATVSPDLTGYTKLVIAYRPQGGGDFVGVDMRRSGNKFTGEIPADATQGNSVAYYIEAETDDETAVASSGSEEKPYTVSLSEKTSVGDEEEGDGDDGQHFFVAVLGGTGIGYATGNGEVNADNKVNAGFAPSSAAQIAPEVGYFISPDFRLSVQLRFQFVTGATPQNLNAFVAAGNKANLESCGTDHLCSPSTFAFAGFARASWFFGSGTFRPYFSLALGGGAIRHIVKFTSLANGNNPGTCGTSGKEACVDTVLAGPIFAGPGGGVLIDLTRNFGFVVELGSLLGFPKFTFHIDVNAGVAGHF